ncbi:hypothetical protein DER44DRAFT_747645 [Fusarium oxysporum]|nr:hypothetical protein DER44DRAFT_747645 [Fusarium oxysporum]
MVANNLPILIRPQGPQYITTLGACRAQAVKRKRHRLVELVGDGIPAGSLRWFPFYQDRKLGFGTPLTAFGFTLTKKGCMEALKAVWCAPGTGRISLAHGALGSDDRTVESAPQQARSQGSRHSVLVLMVDRPLSLFLLSSMGIHPFGMIARYVVSDASPLVFSLNILYLLHDRGYLTAQYDDQLATLTERESGRLEEPRATPKPSPIASGATHPCQLTKHSRTWRSIGIRHQHCGGYLHLHLRVRPGNVSRPRTQGVDPEIRNRSGGLFVEARPRHSIVIRSAGVG